MSLAGMPHQYRLFGALGALLMFLSLAGPAVRPVAAQSNDDPPLDLAAMILTPEDLAAEGLDEFGVSGGYGEVDPDQLVRQEAASRGIEEDEVRELIESAGWLRSYDYTLVKTEDPENPESPTVVYVRLTITEYADTDGAATGFAFLEDEDQIEAVPDREGTSNYDDVEVRELGDESETTLLITEPDTSPAYPWIESTFRIDNLVASVKIDQAVEANQEEEPDPEVVSAVAARLLDRIEEIRDEPGGLSTRALHLTAVSELAVSTYVEQYSRLNGQIIQFGYLSLEDIAEQDKAYDENGIVDVFRLRTGIESDNLMIGDTLVDYSLGLWRFEDDEAAASWIEGRVDDLVASNDASLEIETLDEAREFGDQSVTVAYVAQDDKGNSVPGHQIFARVGDHVAAISLNPVRAVASLEATERLMEAQVACLEAGVCMDPIPVPEELLGSAADAETSNADQEDTEPAEEEQTPDADGDERPASGSDGTTYTSPTYGYSLEWDGDTWVVSQEDDDPDDGMDTLLLQNFNTGVYVYFRTMGGFEGNPDACVEAVDEEITNREGIENVERNDELDVLETPRGVPAAAAVYTYGQDGEEYAEAVYCLDLGDGDAVLQVFTRGLLRFYDAHLTSNQELLDGLELREAADAETEADEDAAERRETGDEEETEDEETRDTHEPVPEGGIDGTTYTSPTYGYTLEWDEDEWTADTETAVAPDRDTLILDAADGTGFVYVEGYEAYDGDPEDCVEGAADELLSTEGYVDVEPLELDRDLAEAPDDGAIAAYTLTYETSGGQEVPGVAYVACQSLVEGEAVLAVSYITFAVEYEDGIEAVQDVMASLELAEQ